MGRIAAGSNDFQLLAASSAGCVADSEQERAGVDLRALEQTVERNVGQRNDVGALSQLERKLAKLRCGAADLGARRVVGLLRFGRFEIPTLIAAMRDHRRLERVENAFLF